MGVGTRPSGAAGRRGTAARGGRPGSGGAGESGRADGVARRRFRGQPQRRQHPPHRVGLGVCPEKADVFSGSQSHRGKSQTPCRCSRQRPLFLLVKVQPRQLASQPGSILDRRGGHESAESSSGNALGCRGAVPNGQEGKRAGGPQHYGMVGQQGPARRRDATFIMPLLRYQSSASTASTLRPHANPSYGQRRSTHLWVLRPD
jgi:hypothetical protein